MIYIGFHRQDEHHWLATTNEGVLVAVVNRLGDGSFVAHNAVPQPTAIKTVIAKHTHFGTLCQKLKTIWNANGYWVVNDIESHAPTQRSVLPSVIALPAS